MASAPVCVDAVPAIPLEDVLALGTNPQGARLGLAVVHRLLLFQLATIGRRRGDAASHAAARPVECGRAVAAWSSAADHATACTVEGGLTAAARCRASSHIATWSVVGAVLILRRCLGRDQRQRE